MMKFREIVLSAVLATAPLSPAFAQTAVPSEAAVYEVPEGPVEVYGQTLDPQAIRLRPNSLTNHPVYTWDDLKGHMPGLLPDAQTKTMTPESVCDDIVVAYKLSRDTLEKFEQPLIYEFSAAYPDNAAFEVTERTVSPSSEAWGELMAASEKVIDSKGYAPEKRDGAMDEMMGKLSLLRELTAQNLTLVMLHDAAIQQCPIHAAQKEYSAITTYDGPDKDYVPEVCKGDSPEPWCPPKR